ncbi:DUF6630 family protein [Myroides sp. LJL116]
MGIFSKFFGIAKTSKSETTLNDKSTPVESKINVEFYQKLIDTIVTSESLKNELKIKIQQAFKNPKSFYDEDDEFILSERGLTFCEDDSLTPKFVLVDTLKDNDQMAEVDWKEDEHEIRFVLNKIIKAKGYNFKLSEDLSYQNNQTFEIIELINEKELKPIGFSLEILDIDSDSYVFTVIPSENQKEVQWMFDTLK